MAHKGVREFTGDEVSNLAIGQAGFDLVTGATVTAASQGIEYWVALKAVGANCDLKAFKHDDFPGDNFTDDGTTTGGTLELENGDIVYGAFKSIVVPASDYIIAYRGR